MNGPTVMNAVKGSNARIFIKQLNFIMYFV